MLFGKSTSAPPTEELPPDVAIRVENVSKRFKDFWALQNVSFDVRKGECVGIVGFNGAGKSTLLQIIADTLQPTDGEARSRGRVVAMLELGSGFNPEYTGIENLYMNAAILGIPQKVIDQKLEEIEAFAEIGEHLHKPVKTYSSGMVVRLAFSLLTQIDPDVMIIDEALSVGDTYFAFKCSKLIKKYRAQGKTFLFVSHNDTAVKSLCDRAILIDKGALLRDGKPADVLDYYNAMVAQKERELEIRQIEKEQGRVVTRSGNGRVTIDRFELMNRQHEPRRRFAIGESALVSCVIEAKESVPPPTVGFMIRDRFGNDIFGTNTYHLGTSTRKLETGEQIEATFETQLDLGPGEYSLTLAVHEGPVHIENNYDWFDRLIVFQILPDPTRFFSGVAYLRTSAGISRSISQIHRNYEFGSAIDFTDTGNSHRYRLHGWSKPEHAHTWTDGPEAALELTVSPTRSDMVLTLSFEAFTCPSHPSQRFTIELNGDPIHSGGVQGAQRLELPISAKRLRDSNRLVFKLPDCRSPKSFDLGSDSRKLGIAVRSMSIAPRSTA